ncbi:MAG: cadmium-translocating P-type ATPase [Candidatus Schekmanbacteria bacterium]|nr:MAG: cadmium-translocating P-type ATPase [Candidatus Schekmanbacteria bacterium]
MYTEFRHDAVSLSEIISVIKSFGYRVKDAGYSIASRKMTFNVRGMDCADCAVKLERQLSNLEGVEDAWVDFNLSRMTVKYSEKAGMIDKIMHLVDRAGYTAFPLSEQTETSTSIWGWIKNDRKAVTTVICGILIALAYVFQFLGIEPAEIGFYAAAMLVGGFYVARAGISALRYKTIDMNFLMTIAILGAVFIGEWEEGAMVVFLFSLGNVLQNYTMDKTRNSIRYLMDLSPKEARIQRGENQISVPVTDVKVGEIMIILPGEKIAMDGKVVKGESEVNEASITGESVPAEKREGSEVFAGTINGSGTLEVEITKPYEETTLSKIIHLVEEAQAQKAPSQLFIDAFAKYYTPTVIIFAFLIVCVPVLLFGADFNTWFYKGLMLLVIACPCALVISTPVSIVSAIGNASKNGVLIKGGVHLEEAGRVRAIAFDKTGTLTKGHAGITDIISLSAMNDTDILKYAASIEQRSEHPIGKIIKIEAELMGLTLFKTEKSKALTGLGMQAEIDNKMYYIGSRRLIDEKVSSLSKEADEIVSRLESEGKTVLFVADSDSVLGVIALRDMIREDSAQAVSELKKAGIKEVVMLTGDNPKTAEAVANQIGITECKAQLMPQDKVSVIKQLKEKYKSVAMVGEGINDAPALAAADVGIAMGVAGTDTALETADIALMSDDMLRIPYTMKLSRKSLGIIKANIAISLIVKAVFFVLVFAGLANLWLAVLADTGTSLVVILNGMRLLRFGKRRKDEVNEVKSHAEECADACDCGHDHDHSGHDHSSHSHEGHDHDHEHSHDHDSHSHSSHTHNDECGCGHDHSAHSMHNHNNHKDHDHQEEHQHSSHKNDGHNHSHNDHGNEQKYGENRKPSCDCGHEH